MPSRIPAGGKYSPGAGLILQKLIGEEKGKYQICGPTAFNFYGLDDQIPSVTYLYNNRISAKRSIGSLAFQFIKVADERLGALNAVRTQDTEIIYSSKARTLMDAVYDWSRFNSLPQGYDWIKRMIKNDFKLAAELLEATIKYGDNQANRVFIRYDCPKFETDKPAPASTQHFQRPDSLGSRPIRYRNNQSQMGNYCQWMRSTFHILTIRIRTSSGRLCHIRKPLPGLHQA